MCSVWGWCSGGPEGWFDVVVLCIDIYYQSSCHPREWCHGTVHKAVKTYRKRWVIFTYVLNFVEDSAGYWCVWHENKLKINYQKGKHWEETLNSFSGCNGSASHQMQLKHCPHEWERSKYSKRENEQVHQTRYSLRHLPNCLIDGLWATKIPAGWQMSVLWVNLISFCNICAIQHVSAHSCPCPKARFDNAILQAIVQETLEGRYMKPPWIFGPTWIENAFLLCQIC